MFNNNQFTSSTSRNPPPSTTNTTRPSWFGATPPQQPTSNFGSFTQPPSPKPSVFQANTAINHGFPASFCNQQQPTPKLPCASVPGNQNESLPWNPLFPATSGGFNRQKPTTAFENPFTMSDEGTKIKFCPTIDVETAPQQETKQICSRYQSMSTMKEFQSKSFEELRFEDYNNKNKAQQPLGSQFQFAAASATGFAAPKAMLQSAQAPSAAPAMPIMASNPLNFTPMLSANATTASQVAPTHSNAFAQPQMVTPPYFAASLPPQQPLTSSIALNFPHEVSSHYYNCYQGPGSTPMVSSFEFPAPDPEEFRRIVENIYDPFPSYPFLADVTPKPSAGSRGVVSVLEEQAGNSVPLRAPPLRDIFVSYLDGATVIKIPDKPPVKRFIMRNPPALVDTYSFDSLAPEFEEERKTNTQSVQTEGIQGNEGGRKVARCRAVEEGTFRQSCGDASADAFSVTSTTPNSSSCKMQPLQPGYYTIPDLSEIPSESGDFTVKGFTIGRHNFGSVYFPDEINISKLNLAEIVRIRYREVAVYPEDDGRKPPIGEGLNRSAVVTIENVWPKDRVTGEMIKDPMELKRNNFVEKLKVMSELQESEFISYDPERGSWVFKVQHFSKYKFVELCF